MNGYLLIAIALFAGCCQTADKRASTTQDSPKASVSHTRVERSVSDTPADSIEASVTYTPADSAEIVGLLSKGDTTTLAYANHFLDRPYVAHTLEVNDEEQLVVNTRQLDCTTLVESVTALTLCAQRQQNTFADYCRMLQLLRYRGGLLDGYPSRLHYFSDWIIDKEAMGIVHEILPTAMEGSIKGNNMTDKRLNNVFSGVQKLNIYYMSRHPKSYKALKNHPEYVDQIAEQEKLLTGRTCHFIPKGKIDNSQLLRNTIHDGDIIAITCSKAGLDIAHLGFAVWQTDGLHLLNASQIHKKVVLEPMTLKTYLAKHPSHTGIRILRIANDKNWHPNSKNHQQ